MHNDALRGRAARHMAPLQATTQDLRCFICVLSMHCTAPCQTLHRPLAFLASIAHAKPGARPIRSLSSYQRLLQPAYNMPNEPRITSVEPLPANEAKWIEFQKISWTDQTSKARVWEAASRKTRGKSGVDAVAVGSHHVPSSLPQLPTSNQAVCPDTPDTPDTMPAIDLHRHPPPRAATQHNNNPPISPARQRSMCRVPCWPC